MITISKYNNTFLFNEDDPSTLDEIFNDNYKIIEKGVPFKSNDLIIDIGANIGMFSILYAKLHPYVKIYACEPVAETYIRLCKNIKINNITNIIPINTAVSGGEKIKQITYHPQGLGGASSHFNDLMVKNIEGIASIYVSCITLDELMLSFNINECQLLKIDCEGAEYDIIYNSKLLNRINYLVGEFHENTLLRQAGHSYHKLGQYCATQVKHMLYYEFCDMHE